MNYGAERCGLKHSFISADLGSSPCPSLFLSGPELTLAVTATFQEKMTEQLCFSEKVRKQLKVSENSTQILKAGLNCQ